MCVKVSIARMCEQAVSNCGDWLATPSTDLEVHVYAVFLSCALPVHVVGHPWAAAGQEAQHGEADPGVRRLEHQLRRRAGECPRSLACIAPSQAALGHDPTCSSWCRIGPCLLVPYRPLPTCTRYLFRCEPG